MIEASSRSSAGWLRVESKLNLESENELGTNIMKQPNTLAGG